MLRHSQLPRLQLHTESHVTLFTAYYVIGQGLGGSGIATIALL